MPPTGPARYIEWVPAPELRRFLVCSWTGGIELPGTSRGPILPDACIDIIFDGVQLFVAGPDTGPAPSEHAGSFTVGVRFRPGMGPLFLGVPAGAITDDRVDLAELWPEAGALAEELDEAPTYRRAARILETAVARRLTSVSSPDPLVEITVRAFSSDPRGPASSFLAARAGLSERQVQRRFVAAVGYGPKLLQRVLRLQRFLAAARHGGRSLGELAQEAGYADQPHLNRETAALAGATPSVLRAERGGDVRNVQDT